jgi:hypothetical protein
MRYNFKLCLLLCLLAQNLVAQHRYLAWVDHQTTLRRKIDIDAGILLSEQANGSWLSEKNTGLRIESTCNLPTQIENNFFRINQGKDLLFTINGSQKVYQYTPATQNLSRLDKTIHQGYNYHSSQFMRKDTLFSIGGYGFWQFNNIVTFFDKNLSEWSLVKTNGQKPSSIVDGFRGYDKEEEVFYTAGSMAVDSDYKNERTYSNEAYRLDFKTLTWEFLGTVNPKLPKQKGYEIDWTGKYFIYWSVEHIYIIDPEKNIIYESDNKLHYIEANTYIKEDKIYCYWIKEDKIDELSINELLQQAKVIGPFYSKDSAWLSSLSIAFGIALLILCAYLFYFKKRTRKKTNSSDIFNTLEKDLINAFLKLDSDEYLNVNEINHILNINQRSQETQRKMRVKSIKEVNNKIATHYKIEEGIVRKDAEDDKRLKLYALQPELYQLLKAKF